MDEFDLLDELFVAAEGRERPRADRFGVPVAFRTAVFGIGRDGARIASAFSGLGYARVASLAEWSDPGDDRAAFARGGPVEEMLRRAWDGDHDRAWICAGTDGVPLAMLRELADRLDPGDRRPVPVGAIVALPVAAAGRQAAQGALRSLGEARQAVFSPLVLLDHAPIAPRVGSSGVAPAAARAVATILHLFNRHAAAGGGLDREALADLWGPGLVALGLCQAPDQADSAVDALARGMLGPFGPDEANKAGLLLALGDQAEDASAQLGEGLPLRLLRRMVPGAAVYNDVVTVPGPRSYLAAMLGGLPWPARRIAAVEAIAGVGRDGSQTLSPLEGIRGIIGENGRS